jgi:hypothetical protein
MRYSANDPQASFTVLDELLLSIGFDRISIRFRIMAFAFSSIFLAGGLAVFHSAVAQPIGSYLGSKDWEISHATVTESKLDWDDGAARVDIKYSYRIDGNDYNGERYGWDRSRQNFGIAEKQKIVDRHNIGSSVTIWIDPDEPSESVINRSHTGISGINLLFPIPFLLVGICGISFAWLAGWATARTRVLMGLLAETAEQNGLPSIAGQLRYPPNGKDPSRKLVFSMAQGRVEGFGILFAAIFWNGIVGVFLSLLVEFIISGDGTALFLGPFLIPFVIIGVWLIITAVKRFRAPRPPAYVFGFSGLSLTIDQIGIPVTWMRLDGIRKSPDATNMGLGIQRDFTQNPISFGKPRKYDTDEQQETLFVSDKHGEGMLLLKPAAKEPQKWPWKPQGNFSVTATFTWEEKPRRETKSVTWLLIAPESDG